MFLKKMIGFYKSLGCPASDLLFDVHTGKLGNEETEEIQSHAEGCDFCGAELELYSNYPDLDDGGGERSTTCPTTAGFYQYGRSSSIILSNDRRRDISSPEIVLYNMI